MQDAFTIRSMIAALGITAAFSATPALALDEVSYGTNWLAQAEHGGFYQAVADGTYEKYGLKVTIIQGGPQAANRALLIAGKVDFYMGGPLGEMDAVKQGIPLIDVASMFQKDPQVILAHPGQGIETFADLAKLESIYMSKDGYVTYFEWMKKNFPGFTDAQYKPYTFNPAPFIADPKSAQQGYLTSEPYEIKKQAGFEPKVFLLADNGYQPYSTMITTTTTMVESKPDLVQRFVDASIEGWYNYLYGDNKAANDLIKKDNPEMTDGQIEYSIAKMKEYGIVVSGDAETKGIGCITDERYKEFRDSMVQIGVVEESLDYKKAYTTQFVCKGVGMALKK
ncbi:ABC transporter substrate-binding protein [Rhizobium sp. RU36D]|uniref:ABC transporter substrate-binding protein n=1 Tax=Rhizobium sp. RU36D TaxID=1907415 RepID=UPI0009D83EFC|nr:ABC transporter substrate-binding protein [Rhizobium sp. RU36D]SMC40427.1 NitT/TauT family transport system substrate-binding protein [Rhizobium sp. RU36D]